MDFDEFERARWGHLLAKSLYEDDEFPTAEDRAFFNRGRTNVQWLRPRDLCESNGSEAAVFFRSNLLVEHRYTEDQGYPVRFNRLVPSGQTFDPWWYAGIFIFRFYRYGYPIYVAIDDRLPCYEGNILSVRKKRPYELINPLVEKAYAKLYGGYDVINDYTFENIMSDFYGRTVEPVSPSTPLNDLYGMLLKGLERDSWVIATSKNHSSDLDRVVLPNGLVTCCPYVINRILAITNGDGPAEYLIRTRTLWPMDITYIGPWSVTSPEWNRLSEEDRAEQRLTLQNEIHEFWLRLEDLVSICSEMQLCHPIALLAAGVNQRWSERVCHSEWRLTATFYQNPQFLLTINSGDRDDDNYATIILELTQKHRRRTRQRYLRMAYYIFLMADQPEIPLHSRQITEVFRNDGSSPVRSVVERYNLAVGRHYLIIPTIRDVDQPGQFLIRILSGARHELVDWTAKPL